MKRTLYKALTYKLLSLTVTVAVTAFLTGSVAAALSLGLADAVFKMGLYVANEAAWEKFSRKGLVGAVLAAALAVAECVKKAHVVEGPCLRA